MQPEISLAMQGISGLLRYVNGEERYDIRVENTGDYSRGTLVFIQDLDGQIQGPAALKRKSQILNELRAWSKATGKKLCWAK